MEKLKEEFHSIIEDIAEEHSKFYSLLFAAKSKILKQEIISGELSFNIEITPQNNTFNEKFVGDVCNLKTLNSFEKVPLSGYNISVNSEDFKKDIKQIIIGLLWSKLKIKTSYTKKEAITKLVQNWFIFDYKIKQNGDEISEMSPGKKSFVLLKLLIELDNSGCPILLDQPEDDLDNRSIYGELVEFIKNKKIKRQIIIATHNPNLVVGADSECVIVANQKGDETDNRNFQFEYVQGALENTFIDEDLEYILEKQGIQEHVCDILEGGEKAFNQRRKKYNF